MKLRAIVDYNLAMSAVLTCGIAAHHARLRAARYEFDATVATDAVMAEWYRNEAQRETDTAEIYDERGSLLMDQITEGAFVVEDEPQKEAA